MTPRTTTFDRTMRKIDAEAINDGHPWTPRNAARLYLLAERAAGDAHNDDALGELGDLSTNRLHRIAATRSRNAGDVAAKLAALIVENGQNDPAQSGGLDAAIHAGMCSCLAELVILGDQPLPDASAVLDMRAPDFELRDATEAEMAESRAEAQAEKAEQSAQVAPNDDGRPRDALLDLEDAHTSISGVLAGIYGLRDLLGRPWTEQETDDRRRAALWAAEALEACAENVCSMIESATTSLTKEPGAAEAES